MQATLPPQVTAALRTAVRFPAHAVLTWRYAVCISFLLFFHAMSAQTWTPVSGTFTDFTDMWGTNASNIWAVGGNAIRKYDGVSWNVVYGVSGGEISAIHGTSISNIWAAAPYFSMLRYNGSAWSQQTALSDIVSVWTSGPSNVYALDISGELWHYDGVSWTSEYLPTFQIVDHYDIWGASPSNIRIVGSDGTILHYDGVSWNIEADASSLGIYAYLRSIWGADANNIWAVGFDGTIVHYDGVSWSQQSTGVFNGLNCVWGIDANNVWAVGDNGRILKYDGVSWTTQNSGVNNSLTGIWGSGNKFWVCGKFPGILLYSTNQFPPLPVELIDFQARLQPDQTARLQWQTASERDNTGFDVERSTDGKNWSNIGFVAGKGTTAEKQSYQFTDHQPLPGHNNYRLAQHDSDGKTSLSDIEQIVLPGAENDGFSVFPNPVIQGEITVQLSGEPSADASIRVYSADGRTLLQQPATSTVHTFRSNEWTPGIYLIEVKNGEKTWQEQVVVK